MKTIKDVPMQSSDEVDIEMNLILYTVEWESGYGYRKEGKASIEAHRVISVDNSTRFFRTRCKEGCETTHQISKGCSRARYFAKIETAKDHLIERIKEDLHKCVEKSKQIDETTEHLRGEIRKVDKLSKITLPKKVAV